MTITGYYSNLLNKVPKKIKTLLIKRKLTEPEKEIFTVMIYEKYILIY